MVKVDIVLDHSRIFLFPASVALGSETNVIPPDDTTVRGEVVITSEEHVRIGPIRIVWEVARELKGKNSWGKRDVLARFESEVTMDDSYIEHGETRYLFTLQIPSLLPPTTETAFDKTSHTLVASVLDPAPTYSADLPPSYDTDSSPRRQESFSSLSDWSFPSSSEASRRSSLLSTPSGSQRSSIDTSRSGWSTPADSRRSSLAIPSSSRSSLSMSSSDRPEPRKQKKSLLGGFLRKSSTLSQATTDEPISQVDLIPTTPTCNDVELAEWLLPSSAASTRSLEVISCPAARGEICTVDWMKGSHTPGLGHSQRYIHSSIFSLGSGVNFDYNLSEIPASSTVHSIRLSLCQTTKAANSNKEEAVFTLFSRGTSSEGEHVWRGEVARSWDAQAQKSKPGRRTIGPVPQASLPGVVAGASGLRIRTKARLPTPMNGAVPTSPRLLDNRLSRVTHHLRIETFYSVLGEDVSGAALPMDTKSKDGRPQEGTIRRTWVDHEVIIGACCITPENILVPTYSASASPNTTITSSEGRQQTRTKAEDFSMPKTCTHTFTTERGRRVSEQHETPNADRLASHAQVNDSRCLCFHDDASIAEMIGSLEKPNQHHVNLAQIDIGGIVKALYVPVGLQAEVEDLAPVQDVWRRQSAIVACS